MNTQPGYIRSGADRACVEPDAPASLGRLKRRSDFLRVAATRRRMATPGLVLQVADVPESGAATGAESDRSETEIRIGFTASRKVGGSVARNRARRRLREAVKRVMPEHARTCRDYVVIARRGTLDRPFDRLVGDLESALKRLDSWRPAQ